MGIKGHPEKENRAAENIPPPNDKESSDIKDDLSEGVLIEGGSDNLHYGKTILGFDEGIVVKDAVGSKSHQAVAASKEDDH